MSTQHELITGTASGVPFVARPPEQAASTAPVVIGWHLLDPPCTEAAFAAALPLDGLDAWRISLGLPMTGARTPAGGREEVMRLGFEDAVLNLYGPIAERAVAELPAALDALRAELAIGAAVPFGLLGGSQGSAVAQLALLEAAPALGLDVAALAVVSPLVQLRPVVTATARLFGVAYDWTAASDAVADRLDFVRRADEYVAAGQPPVRLVVGADDDPDAFVEPTAALAAALRDRYDDAGRVDRVVVDGLGHALAEEPGTVAAPQLPKAAEVDGHVVEWFARWFGERR